MCNSRNNRFASVIFLFIISMMACKNHIHKKEVRQLEKERMEAEKAASDLNAAVKITDEAGWNGKEVYAQFKANALRELADDERRLDSFNLKVKMGKKRVPLLYRSRMQGIRVQIRELKSRVNNYKLSDKAHWEDFGLLFNDDKKRMEHALNQLINR